MLNTISATNSDAVRSLSVEELDTVSGGNPVLGVRIAWAIAGYIGGKAIDGITDGLGIFDPIVEVKGGKIYMGGRKLN